MKRKPYRFFLYLLLELISLSVGLLPYNISMKMGAFFGNLAYYILKRYRNLAVENLNSVFGAEKSEKEVKKIAKDVFRNLGLTATECLCLRKFNRERIKRLAREDDYFPIREILSKGKGVIIISSHFGNWEMSAICGAAYGLDVTVIARRIYYDLYNRFLVGLRQRHGVKILYRDDKNVLKKSLKLLKENRILGIAPDQDVDSVEGVFVDFLRRPAYTPTGPVVLAMLSGAPLLPTFMIRKDGEFRLFVEQPIFVKESGDRDADIVKYTQEWSRVVEKYIRKYPSHWVWMHRRWKTVPGKVEDQIKTSQNQGSRRAQEHPSTGTQREKSQSHKRQVTGCMY